MQKDSIFSDEYIEKLSELMENTHKHIYKMLCKSPYLPNITKEKLFGDALKPKKSNKKRKVDE